MTKGNVEPPTHGLPAPLALPDGEPSAGPSTATPVDVGGLVLWTLGVLGAAQAAPFHSPRLETQRGRPWARLPHPSRSRFLETG